MKKVPGAGIDSPQNQLVNDSANVKHQVWETAKSKFLEQIAVLRTNHTRKKYVTAFNALKRFEPQINFDLVNVAFLEDWKIFMISEGYLNNSITKHMNNLRSFLNWSYVRDYHSNESFKKYKYQGYEKYELVTLNENDIQAVRTVPLENSLARVRDLFLFCYYTGCRYQDSQNFHRSQLIDNLWIYTAQKTGKSIKVPLVGYSLPALEIIQKYGNTLPKISNQKANDYLKEVCKKAGLTKPITIKKKSGNKVITFTGKQYEFISFHTAKRSIATNLLTKGVPINIVIKLTGHSTVKQLLHYDHSNVNDLEAYLQKI